MSERATETDDPFPDPKLEILPKCKQSTYRFFIVSHFKQFIAHVRVVLHETEASHSSTKVELPLNSLRRDAVALEIVAEAIHTASSFWPEN